MRDRGDERGLGLVGGGSLKLCDAGLQAVAKGGEICDVFRSIEQPCRIAAPNDDTGLRAFILGRYDQLYARYACCTIGLVDSQYAVDTARCYERH